MFEKCNFDVGILSLDQEKAFDRADHVFYFLLSGLLVLGRAL